MQDVPRVRDNYQESRELMTRGYSRSSLEMDNADERVALEDGTSVENSESKLDMTS